jgi:orotidine-5'-phosphate decarboxylase
VTSLSKRPEIWGVTVLTSLGASDLNDLGFQHAPIDLTRHLAALAKRSGLDGIVASVGETAQLRADLGPNFTIVTPGIRMPDNAVGDQKRKSAPTPRGGVCGAVVVRPGGGDAGPRGETPFRATKGG